MQIDHRQDTCQHKGCTCTVPQGEEYCSDHCRAAAAGALTREEDRAICACGHEQCKADEMPRAH